MHRVSMRQVKGRKGWFVYWQEAGRRYAKALPDKPTAQHYRDMKYAQLNSDVFTGTVNAPWRLMVEEYLQTYDRTRKAASSKQEAELTLRHFERHIGALASRHITQRMIDLFITRRGQDPAMPANRQKRKVRESEAPVELSPISDYTLKKDISNLRAFLSWAQNKQRRYISRDVEVESIKVTKRQPKPLDPAQAKELLLQARARSECWYMRVLLLLSTGLRAGDVETLSVQDIDFARNCIDSKSRKTRKGMLFRPLPAKIMPIVEKYVAELPPGDGRLLAADSNTHKKWRQIRTRAGLPNLRLQDLRVTFSSSLQVGGVSLSIAQRLLEHSDPKLTANTYTNVDAALVDAVNKLPVDDWL